MTTVKAAEIAREVQSIMYCLLKFSTLMIVFISKTKLYQKLRVKGSAIETELNAKTQRFARESRERKKLATSCTNYTNSLNEVERVEHCDR
jgi:hypothetical protein